MLTRLSAALCAFLLATPAIAQPAIAQPAITQPAATLLDQGWTGSERDLWWNQPQGSRILPYPWFLKLETADGTGPFAAPDNLARYGYIPAGATAINPDALPIGFAKERDRPSGSDWLGMTCAACHTATLAYQGKTLLIEGAGSFADTMRFDRDLSAALSATASDDARFARFADRLGALAEERPTLRERVAKVAQARVAFTNMNTPPQDPGPGRVDALGVIMNALTATALDKPGNAHAPDAPVRMPWIWGAVRYARAQYNGSISNAGLGPVLRNIGQTLGVYGVVDVSQPPGPYPSSVAVANLDTLEALARKLTPPAWPAGLFGPVDPAKAEQGAAVFKQTCASCHGPKPLDANGLVPTPQIPLDQIGTDPRAARNFMTRTAETGVLEGRPMTVLGGAPFGPKAPAATIVGHISTAVALQIPKERLQAGLTTYRAAMAADPGRLDAYKAMPLAGIWAAAPYLHNGSVANIKELLTPPGQRAPRFTTAGRDYDPALLGYPADTTTPGYVLDTTLPGNSNAGHDFGTGLPEADKAALIEYLKTL